MHSVGFAALFLIIGAILGAAGAFAYFFVTSANAEEDRYRREHQDTDLAPPKR